PARRFPDAHRGAVAAGGDPAGRSVGGYRHAGGADRVRRRGADSVVREGGVRVRGRRGGGAGAVLLAAADPVGRRAALAPCWHLRVSPRSASTLRRAAAVGVGAAGGVGAIARVGGGHADRLRAHGTWSVRRRHAGGPGTRAAGAGAGGDDANMTGTGVIAFQGVAGAYSDLACRTAYPEMQTLPCESFETAMEAVHDGRADLAMLPCENSLAGRVPDIHHLLPESGLYVIGEAFQRVEHCLLGVKGASIGDLKRAHSHTVALGQVRHSLRAMGLTPVVEADTAGAAQLVAQWGRKEEAAVASSLAAEIYGLEILQANI